MTRIALIKFNRGEVSTEGQLPINILWRETGRATSRPNMADKLETEEQPGACIHMLHVRPRLWEWYACCCFMSTWTLLLGANTVPPCEAPWGIHK